MTQPHLAIESADLERRFGGLRRLYGEAAYQRLRGLRLAVVGLGGVGSWAVEALARSGVAELVLIDMDHVAESNINRQIQALSATLGQAKGQALADRIAQIHPACRVHLVDNFVGPENWPGLLPVAVDGVIDACDQVRAKVAMAQWSLAEAVPLVCVGAAGGKSSAERTQMSDLAQVTHDPLLASVRQRLRQSWRQSGSAPRLGRQGQFGLACVHSLEPVLPPQDAACDPASKLACHGYGSSVMVTASFGMTAASALVGALIQAA